MCPYMCMSWFVVIVNSQELEQCLLEKEEELRITQSRAAEMEQELHTALQEKQVSKATSFRLNDCVLTSAIGNFLLLLEEF